MSSKHLKKLKINNFQSLKNVDINFSDTITTIVGKTDSGKSAILRALRALCFNASGNDFITFGETKTTVEGVFDGGSVRWEKGGNTNRFILNENSDEKVFDKVGKAVPDEVTDFLQIKDVEIAESKLRINFAEQFDVPFLLWESGVKASKILGKLTNLDSVYEALGECSLDVKRLKSDLKFNEETVESKKEKLKEFEGVDEQKAFLQSVQDKMDEVKSKIVKCDVIEEVMQRIDMLASQKKIRVDKLAENRSSFIDIAGVSEKMEKYLQIVEIKGGLVSLKKKREILKGRYSEQVSSVGVYEAGLSSLRQKIEICPLCKTNLKCQ